MTNEEKLRETFPDTIFIFWRNPDDLTAGIRLSDGWLQADYNQMYNDSEPCEDVVSRQAVLDALRTCFDTDSVYDENNGVDYIDYDEAVNEVLDLPPVTPKQRLCKDCKFFEYDSVAKVDGIPLIVAHEICNKWGNGCRTSEDGYCFLFEPQESEEKR